MPSAPSAMWSDARRVEPASVRTSVPASRSIAARPIRFGMGARGGNQRRRPAIIRCTTMATPSASMTMRLPTRRSAVTARPVIAVTGGSIVRTRNGVAMRTPVITWSRSRGRSACR